jgi:hypothetical protein
LICLKIWGTPASTFQRRGDAKNNSCFHFTKKKMKNNILPLPFNSARVPAEKRIGPHNFLILSIIIGSLLGDGSMERYGNGSRFAFYQSKAHGEYLLWLHKTISSLGYAKPGTILQMVPLLILTTHYPNCLAE